MSKKLEFTYNGKEYTLEYNRRTIETMYNRWKYAPSENTYELLIKLPILFRGAFLMHHPTTKSELIDEIYSQMKDKNILIEKLVEMYNEPVLSLMDNEEIGESSGNIEWGASF